MLKDVTLGQYFPGDTAIHKMDPRTKLVLVIVYIVALFGPKHFFDDFAGGGCGIVGGFGIIVCFDLFGVGCGDRRTADHDPKAPVGGALPQGGDGPLHRGKRRCQKRGDADNRNIRVLLRGQNKLLRRDIHAEVDDLDAGKKNSLRDHVFSDVMQIALHCAEDHFLAEKRWDGLLLAAHDLVDELDSSRSSQHFRNEDLLRGKPASDHAHCGHNTRFQDRLCIDAFAQKCTHARRRLIDFSVFNDLYQPLQIVHWPAPPFPDRNVCRRPAGSARQCPPDTDRFFLCCAGSCRKAARA